MKRRNLKNLLGFIILTIGASTFICWMLTDHFVFAIITILSALVLLTEDF